MPDLVRFRIPFALPIVNLTSICLCRHDFTSNKHYFIDQNKGTQNKSDPHGNVIRPFDPNLTGKYDYEGRKKLQEGLPVNFGGVELPKSLDLMLNRVYSPESIHFEGYTQFPLPVSMPYTNEKSSIKKDEVVKHRSREAMHNMKTMRDSFFSKWNKRLIANISENTNFLHNNVGASFLTAPLNYSVQPEVQSIAQRAQNRVMGDIDGYKAKIVKS